MNTENPRPNLDIYSIPRAWQSPVEIAHNQALKQTLVDHAEFASSRAEQAISYFRLQYRDSFNQRIMEQFSHHPGLTHPSLISSVLLPYVSPITTHRTKINRAIVVNPSAIGSTAKKPMKHAILTPRSLSFVEQPSQGKNSVPVMPATIFSCDFICDSWGNYFGDHAKPISGTFAHHVYYDIRIANTNANNLYFHPNYNISVLWSEDSKSIIKQSRTSDTHRRYHAWLIEAMNQADPYRG